jgi:hypothetical protein
MREPEKCHLEYCGYKNPRTPKELEFELLGLETVINEAKKRISVLKQSAFLVKVAIEDNNDYSDSR